jgi:hypothetical protein
MTKRADPTRVDTDAAQPTLRCATAQDGWTEYVIARLRRGLSPGCDMRDFAAWWDARKEHHVSALVR